MHPLCEILIRYRILNFKCGAIRIFFKGNTHSYQKVYLFPDTKIKNPCLSRVSWFWATNRQQECRKQVQSVRKHEQNLITKAHTIISPLFSLGEYSQLLVIG